MSKRRKRRQNTLAQAYRHVRQVMVDHGLPVAPYEVPAVVLPGDNMYDAMVRGDQLGSYNWHTHQVAVRQILAEYNHDNYMDTIYHECVHANQPDPEPWEHEIPYEIRPYEIEAREIAALAMKINAGKGPVRNQADGRELH